MTRDMWRGIGRTVSLAAAARARRPQSGLRTSASAAEVGRDRGAAVASSAETKG